MEGFDVCCLAWTHTHGGADLYYETKVSQTTQLLYTILIKFTLLPLSIWSFCMSTNRKFVLAREQIDFSGVVLLTEVAVYPWC